MSGIADARFCLLTVFMVSFITFFLGRKEHVWSIGEMIVQWEGMESKEEEKRGEEESLGRRRRRKRLSKSICELSGRFKEGGNMHDSQLGVGCREGEESLGVSTSSLNILSKLE